MENLHVMVTGDSRSLRAAMLSGAKSVDGMTASTTKMNASLKTTKAVMLGAAAGLGALAVGGLAVGVKKAIEFDKAMRNVNSIAKEGEEQYRATKAAVLELSTEVPQSATVLAEGLYNITSAGFAGAEGLAVLEAAAVSASAGLTGTDQSAAAITAALNAYGLEADRASDVSDILFASVEQGVLTFDELASSTGTFVGIGAAAGIEFDEMAAGLATITKSGISAAEGSTALARVVQSLIDPSAELSSLFADLGYESGQAAIDALGLKGIMDEVRIATDGDATALLELFPNIRATRGAFALLANEGENYNQVAARVVGESNRAGAAQEALEEQSKSLSFQWDMLTSSLSANAIMAGDTVMPVLAQLVEFLNNLVDEGIPKALEGFSELDDIWDDLWETGRSLWRIVETLWDALGPLARALTFAAAGAGVAVLRTLAGILQSVTSFIAESETATYLLATAIGAALVPKLIAMASSLGAVAAAGAAKVIGAIGAAATGAAGGLSAASLAAGALNVALAAAVVGVGFAIKDMADMRKEVEETVDALVEGYGQEYDTSTNEGAMQRLEAQTEAVREQLALVREENEALQEEGTFWRAMVEELPGVTKTVHGVWAELDVLQDVLWDLEQGFAMATTTAESAATQIEYALDLPAGSFDRSAVYELADALGIDLTTAVQWEAVPALTDAAVAAREGTGAYDEQIQSIDALASAHTNAVTAIQEFVDAQRALVDPIFAVHDAVGDLATAQDDAATALKDHGQDSTEYAEATRDVAEAIMDRDAAMSELNVAMLEGTVSQSEAQEALERWVSSGELTQGQMEILIATFEEVFGDAMQWNETTAEAVIGVDADDANAAFDAAEERGEHWDSWMVGMDIDADNSSAMERFREAERQAANLDGRTATINIRANYTAGGPHYAAMAARYGYADGGFFRSYADGGIEDHQAQIAPAGAWRVWAEPETGGEAYIPLSPNKRQRSMDILSEVARVFGAQLVPNERGSLYLPSRDIGRGAGAGAGPGGSKVVDNRQFSVVLPQAASNQDALTELRKLSVRIP